MASKNKVDAQEFYNRVFALQTIKEVHQAVNELLDGFKEREIARTIKVGTISGYLTDYKEHFLKKEHENHELNESVVIDGKSYLQHIAYNLIDLDKEQKAKLAVQRAKSSQKKMGFEEDGELKDLTNISRTDITEIIKQSCECLTSENPATIACGILNLTGLRSAEQGMPRHDHKEAGIIEHTMVVLDEYMIGFRGIVKKRSGEDSLAFYTRATLAPAQLIVDAQEKYLQSLKVQAIALDTQKYKETFYQNVRNEYKRRFGKSLSTLKAYDSDGNLDKEDGTPHKGRSFYACAFRAVLKLNGFPSAASIKFVQLSLAQDSESEVMKYLASFDEGLFINPIYFEVSTNHNDFGKMKNPPVIPVKEAVKSFDIDNFKEGLPVEESMQLVKFLRSGMSETQALLELFKLVRNKKPATKNAEKTDTPEVKEKSRSVIVSEIVEAIMEYNRIAATEGDIKKIAVPSHGLIGEIAKLKIGVTIAPTTVNKHFELHNNALDKELKEMGIVEGMKDKVHNSVCFRGEFSKLAATILEYIEVD